MRIGIDYISALGGGGNATYTRELVKNLSLIDQTNQYFLYTYIQKKFKKEKDLINQANFKYRYAMFPYLFSQKISKVIRKNLFLSKYRSDKLDLFHLTNPSGYYKNLNNFVLTVHDLAPFHREDFAKKSTKSFYQKYFKEMVEKARSVIAVSEFTKKDLLEKFNLPEEKIEVIYEGADDIFQSVKDSSILKQYGIEGKYILSVGEFQPRKNIQGLLNAYALLPKELKEEYSLILVGASRDEESLNRLKKLISEKGIKKNIKILGYIKTEHLPVLYSGAHFFAYLSFLEGFGLPVLESLKCGRPVLISDRSSLPEVAGSAGIMVDPDNPDQIVSEMRSLLKDQEKIKSLEKEIPNQAAKFSWQKTAKQTLALYLKNN